MCNVVFAVADVIITCFWAQVVVVFANAHPESVLPDVVFAVADVSASCFWAQVLVVFASVQSESVYNVVFAVADVNITCAYTHFPEVFNCIHRDTQLVVANSAPAHLQLICRSVDNVKLYVALLQLQMVMQLNGVGCCH